MQQYGYLEGGAGYIRKYKIGASVGLINTAQVGIPVIIVTNSVGVRPATTTSTAKAVGLSIDTGVYTTTQSATMVEGLITVDVRPSLIIRSLLSGGATEGTAATVLTNSTLSAGGTLITDTTNTPAGTWVGGMVWGLTGNNGGAPGGPQVSYPNPGGATANTPGNARVFTTHVATTSVTVTVPFANAIAVNDTFMWAPFNPAATAITGGDGTGSSMTLTTNFYQVRQDVAPVAAAVVKIVDIDMQTRSDTFIHFMLMDHVFNLSNLQ